MSSQRRMDRRALFASGAAAALLAATGVSAASLPNRGGRLRMALSGGTRKDRFDPKRLGLQSGTHRGGLFMQVAMVGALFETLTEVAADGTLRGELATAWKSNEEATVWDFDLRREVTFHNGSPFTAETVTQLQKVANDASVLENVHEIQALGSHRVRFTLIMADAQFPFLLADPQLCLLPEADVEAAVQAGIGTGPYRLHKFEPGRHLIAHRVEGHHKDGRAAWFDSIELTGIDAEAVRAEALREHLVDVADLTHAADLVGATGLTYLPEEGFMSSAVDKCIAVPAQIGSRWPLDNLRAPQRWWMA